MEAKGEGLGAKYFPDDTTSAGLFDAILDELGGEAATPQQVVLISDLVRNERLKARLMKDILVRGIEVRYFNGRQTLKRENKSIGMLQKLQDQSRRTMMALGLIAREKPVTGDDEDSDGDDFEEF